MARTFRSLMMAVGILASIAPNASANVVRFCGTDMLEWADSPQQFRASAIGFPERHFRSVALQAVVARWNNSPAAFQFTLTWNDADVAESNGENEIWFTDDAERMDEAPAITTHEDDCGAGDGDSNITEKDVIFACDAAWVNGCAADYPDPEPWYFGTNRSDISAYDGPQRPFRTTAMHELGHALGLRHEDDEYNIMGHDWVHIHAYGGSATAYPGEDASHGAVRLYGSSAVAREDVAVVHWRYVSASPGGYSMHSRTRILHEFTDQELSNVDPGQRVRAEFTFENNGSNPQEGVVVHYYLSRDRLYGVGDVLLAQSTLTLNRGNVLTTQRRVDIPNTTAAGEYYIIAVVDPRNALTEVYENNNLTESMPFVVN